MKHLPLTLLVVLLMILGGTSVGAYQASSTNYRIERDSINIGGEFSTSTNYSLEDTAGEVGTGTSSSATYQLKAGYQQMEVVMISISSPSDITLSPNINIAGGTADGNEEWEVTTNNDTGYTLRIQADTLPAMKSSGGASFANYTPVGVVPDYAWGVPASNEEFGFTPEGFDITSTYKDKGTDTCGVGSSDTSEACWDSILTSQKTIASTSTSNTAFGGTTTSVRFRAEVGSSSNPTQAIYEATITLTAVTQ